MSGTNRDSRQLDVFDVRRYISKPYERWSFYDVLERFGELVIRRSDFPESDESLGGQPPWCPVLMTKLVIIQDKEGLDDREAIRRAWLDLGVKACLGLGVGSPGPSQPTLVRHRQKMQQLNLHEEYLQRFNRLAQALGLLAMSEAVAIDTVPVHGAGQVLDTFNLLATGIRNLIKTFAKAQGRQPEQVAEQLGLEAYLSRSIKGRFECDWEDEKSRMALLDRLVNDALLLREAVDDFDPAQAVAASGQPPSGDEAGVQQPEQVRIDEHQTNVFDDDDDSESVARPAGGEDHQRDDVQDGHDDDDDSGGNVGAALRQAATIVDDIIAHDVEHDEQGHVAGVRQRAAGDRIISVTDPEMRHGRKSASVLIAGYKAQIVASIVYGLILLTKVVRANVHDGEEMPALVDTLNDQGLRPEWTAGDHAYGTLANHKHFSNHDTELIAPMPRPSNGGRFTKDVFRIDLEARQVVCPAGQTCSEPRWATQAGKKGLRFTFNGDTCRACPLRTGCVNPKAKTDKGRSVFVVPDEQPLIDAHLAQRATADFKHRYHQRVIVEHAIAGFAQCGGKQAHRFGTQKVSFDVAISALAHNLRRLGSIARDNQQTARRLEQILAHMLRAAFLLFFCAWAHFTRKRLSLGPRFHYH